MGQPGHLSMAMGAGAASTESQVHTAGFLHCKCCGHRYAAGHVPVQPCPCDDPAVWGAP
jgi:hypothetical protein